jgi:hypothetical protein
MTLILDQEQTQVLRELLESARRELDLEIARTDTHDFREMLLRRVAVVEAMLRQLEAPDVLLANQIS